LSLTAGQLNRATLGRQLLLGREALDAAAAVHRVVALQAQEPASPYIALWNRVAGFDPVDLDQAFADHAVVKASLLRITLHAVEAGDYPAFHEAMQRTLRAARLNDRRFTSTGLTSDDADTLIPELVAFADEGRTNAAAEAWLEQRFGAPNPRVWWAMRHYGPFVHAPAGGPWSFGARPSYMAAREQRRSGDRAKSMQWLVRRYLEGFGPASVQDIRGFAMVYGPDVRDALEALGDSVVRLAGPTGREIYDVPEGLIPDEDVPAPPRLLPMWDSILLAYADRSRVIPAEYRKLVIRSNGDVLPTILIDGAVAGVWRAVAGGIEVTAFHRLSDEAWHGLEAEARALIAFLADREPTVYRRYGRWWSALSSAEVRVLAGP
jgi:hypothetical protein